MNATTPSILDIRVQTTANKNETQQPDTELQNWFLDPTWNYFVVIFVRYGFPLPVLISCAANILCFITIVKHPNLFPKTTRLHMMCIIINDILLLSVITPIYYFYLNSTVLHPDYRWNLFQDSGFYGIYFCQFFAFFYVYCFPGMTFFQLGLTIDRIVAVVWPLKSKQLLTRKNTLGLIGFLLLVSLSFPAIFVNTVGFYHSNQKNRTILACLFHDDYGNDHNSVFRLYSSYELYLTVFLIISLTAGSFIILVKLCQSVKKLHETTTSENANQRRISTIRLSVMLLLMNFIFAISYLPLSIFQYIITTKLVKISRYQYAILLHVFITLNYIDVCVQWTSYFVGENFRRCFYSTTKIDRIIKYFSSRSTDIAVSHKRETDDTPLQCS